MNGPRLRFCMVTTFYPPANFGGDGIYVKRLAEGLVRAGHEVDVVYSEAAHRACGGGPLGQERPDSAGVGHYPLRSRWPKTTTLLEHQAGTPVSHAGELRAILESPVYDVIHFHNASLMGGPGLFHYGDALKIHTSHDYWLACPTHALFAFDREPCTTRHCLSCTLAHHRPPQLWRQTGALRTAVGALHALLAPSGFTADVLRNEGFETPVYEVGAPITMTEEQPPHAFPPPTFVYAGRLERLKGVLELLRLFENYDKARLVIAGEGTLVEEVRTRAARLPHVDYVGFLPQAKLEERVRNSTAVIAPSLCYETFGLSPAEAIAMGVPAVVRGHGALAELVERSGGGLTFLSDTDWIDALERLRTDPDERRRLGARGAAYAARHWSLDAHLLRFTGLVTELLQRSNSGLNHATGTTG